MRAFTSLLTILFMSLNIPFWLRIMPVVSGLLLCMYYFVTQFMLFAQLAYTKIISNHYEHKSIREQHVVVRKIKKSMVLGLIIFSLVAFQVAVDVKPAFQDFFDQAGYGNSVEVKSAPTIFIISSVSAQTI